MKQNRTLAIDFIDASFHAVVVVVEAQHNTPVVAQTPTPPTPLQVFLLMN